MCRQDMTDRSRSAIQYAKALETHHSFCLIVCQNSNQAALSVPGILFDGTDIMYMDWQSCYSRHAVTTLNFTRLQWIVPSSWSFSEFSRLQKTFLVSYSVSEFQSSTDNLSLELFSLRISVVHRGRFPSLIQSKSFQSSTVDRSLQFFSLRISVVYRGPFPLGTQPQNFSRVQRTFPLSYLVSEFQSRSLELLSLRTAVVCSGSSP